MKCGGKTRRQWISYFGRADGEKANVANLPGRKYCNEARVGLADFPEPDFTAIRHESERRVTLALGDFGDVGAELFIRFARAAARAFGFDRGEDVAGMIIEAVVGDAMHGSAS